MTSQLQAMKPIQTPATRRFFALLQQDEPMSDETYYELVAQGANIHAPDNLGNTALHLASMHPRFGNILIQLLRDKARINTVNVAGKTALHTAAESGTTEAVSLLIKHRADIDVPDVTQRTALSYAAESGNTEAAKQLIGHGADASQADIWGQTPLHYSTRNSHDAVSALLMDSGAPVFHPSLTRYNAVKQKRITGNERWKQWQENELSDVKKLKADDVTSFVGIGKIGQLFKPDRWAGQESHLIQLFAESPPFITKQAMNTHAGIERLVHPGAQVTQFDWAATIAAPLDISQQRDVM